MASTDTTTRVAAAAASANGAGAEQFEVRNPATGETIASLPIHAAENVRDAARRLRDAQRDWEAMGYAGRYRWLSRWRDWIFDNADSLVDVMMAETGKVRHDATLEHPHLADMINFYGKGASKFLADEELSPHAPLMKSKAVKVVYRPQPLVGVIGPWNFPLLLTVGDAIPALCAGSAVLYKPSEFTPLSLLEIVRGWKEEVGGPDVMDVVNGTGDTGGALVDECDFIQFTGSDRTGKVV